MIRIIAAVLICITFLPGIVFAQGRADFSQHQTISPTRRCCVCQKDSSRYCIDTTLIDVADCSTIPQSSAFNSAVESSGRDVSIAGFTCNSGPPLREEACDIHTPTGSASAQCPSAPITIEQIPDQLSTNDDIPESVATPPPVEPVTPRLSVSIPGLSFGSIREEDGYLYIPFLAEYISAVYRYGIGIALIIAIIMVMYGGFRYVLGSATEDVSSGKQIVTDAIIGLVLALSAYLILTTVNPNTLDLNAIKVKKIQPEELELGLAQPHLEDDQADSTATPQCVPYSQCHVDLISVRDLIRDIHRTDPAHARQLLLKIQGCTGDEMTSTAHGQCAAGLSGRLNVSLRAEWLALLEHWPQQAGRLKIGEIYRRSSTQFTGYMALRPACGPLLSGFPAPRSTCPMGGHGNGSAMDIYFVPAGGNTTNNCGEVLPGVPFPQFMQNEGWIHVCSESWHFERTSAHSSPRTNGNWRNIPCFGGGATDAYLTCGS